MAVKHYHVYLDEFGHIGPYLSRQGNKYNESPVFGLGGFIIPAGKSREFATWFFQRKNELLEWELDRSGKHPARFEKKGSALYTTQNFENYNELKRFTNRLLNAFPKFGAHVFYVGLEKRQDTDRHDADALYESVLKEAIKRADQFCTDNNGRFIMVLDEHPSRDRILTAASTTMFGTQMAQSMLEPPFQVESHRFQTIQAADWLCGLIGRLGAYWVSRSEWSDMKWAHEHYCDRLREVSVRSSIRRLPII